MPMLQKPCDLHIAPSMEKLQEMANLDVKTICNHSTSRLCNSARRLLEEAEAKFNAGDEEMAFVYYFKFVDLLVYIKKKKDYNSNSQAMILYRAAEAAMTKLTKLKENLGKRYASRNASRITDTVQDPTPMIIDKTNELKIDEPNIAVISEPSSNSISVTKLYSLLTDHQSSFLIFDVRKEGLFLESHLKHSSCVNVPEEILTPGVTAQQLEKQLPPLTASKWNEKNSVDYVIILDWDTITTEFVQRHPIFTLSEALVKWDLKNPLKKTPLILVGGYKEWSMRYPMYTTKSLDVFSTEILTQEITFADLKDVDYPNLDATLNNEIGPATVRNNTDVLGSGVPPLAKVLNDYVPETKPGFDRLSKPAASASFTAIEDRTSASSSGTKHVPEFNRNLKPAWTSKSENLEDGLNKEEDAVKETLAVTQLVLDREQEFAQLRLRKELEAEESKREEIQKEEERLRENIKSLQLRNLEIEQQFLEIQAENRKMRKLLAQQTDNQQNQKEREIQNMQRKKEEMQKEVERLRKERKIKEREEEERRGKLNQVAKSNGESSHRAGYGLRPNTSENIVPLKDMSNAGSYGQGGLTRSFSSPNIAQMALLDPPVEQPQKRIPSIDRSSKPQLDSPVDLSILKRRNINPIYGRIPCRPATGLRNLGNTCYMNSVIQCLSNTYQIASFFFTGKYKHFIRRNNKQGTNGELTDDFAVVIQALWAGQYKNFWPKDFKMVASKYIPMCVGSEQQDAHEFLVVLMDKLHADLNHGAHDVPSLENLSSLSDGDAQERFWNHHKSKNQSKLGDTFEGLLKSTLTCLSCRKTSSSFETFTCLSVPIPSANCTLLDSVSTFLKPEKMSGEGAWDCPSCKRKMDAEKRFQVCKLPEVLIIQLKRFSYEGIWRKKIQTLVNFHPTATIYDQAYSLYGVVNHIGHLEGGHYTAYCKNPKSGAWYKYDDHEVSEISHSDIVTSNAYVLFYTLKNS